MYHWYRLTEEGEGLHCSEAGLTYGGLPLVAKSPLTKKFEPCGLNAVFKTVLASRAGGIQAVANALNKGDLALACLVAVQLKLPDLDRVAVAKLAKDYNSDEPRDSLGRWTIGAITDFVNWLGNIFNYQPTHEILPGTLTFVTDSGDSFLGPPNTDFSQVYAGGLSIRGIPTGFDAPALGVAEGLGGLFDYQRKNHIFYSQYSYASNYGVGVFLNGAGYSRYESQSVAIAYGEVFSNTKHYTNDMSDWIGYGWDDAEAGRYR